MATSSITAGELFYMAAHSARPVVNHERVAAFLRGTTVLPVDESVAEVYGDLKARLMSAFGPRP